MSDNGNGAAKSPADFKINRFHIDLGERKVRYERVPCEDLEDVFGGIARGFKLLEDRAVDDPYDPAAVLIMNLGILSGTDFMTGLRTYFLAYSPLKTSMPEVPGVLAGAAGTG